MAAYDASKERRLFGANFGTAKGFWAKVVLGGMARTAREVLNELRWREMGSLAEATIWYRDRIAPSGLRIIHGSEIVDLERRYFTTGSAGRLPYYKIERIERAGTVLFERPSSRSRSGSSS